jgi:hypothetical protein
MKCCIMLHTYWRCVQQQATGSQWFCSYGVGFDARGGSYQQQQQLWRAARCLRPGPAGLYLYHQWHARRPCSHALLVANAKRACAGVPACLLVMGQSVSPSGGFVAQDQFMTRPAEALYYLYTN